jgi:hypothetical protein
MIDVAQNFHTVRERVARAAERAGRKADDIIIVGASKQVEVARIEQAMAAGLRHVGENYVQEAKPKVAAIGRRVTWHFIGHLQTNKARDAVRLFDVIHSLDRLELAKALNQRAAALGRVMEVFVEVNIAGEETKSGVAPDEVEALIRQAAALPHLRVRGLMTMPPPFDDPEKSRPYFRALRTLKEELTQKNISNVELSHLSMGMTADFEVAIEEGATIVRIGTGIFGPRSG